MTLAQVAVHCTDPETNQVGTFLFIGDSWRKPNSRVSPVFPGLAELYAWAAIAGWKECPEGFVSQLA